MADRTYAEAKIRVNPGNPPTEAEMKALVEELNRWADEEFKALDLPDPQTLLVYDHDWDYPDYHDLPELLRKMAAEGKVYVLFEHGPGDNYPARLFFHLPGEPEPVVLAPGWTLPVGVDDFLKDPEGTAARLSHTAAKAELFRRGFELAKERWPMGVAV